MSAMHADMATLKAPAKEQAQSQKGNATVEFALILPVFLTLLAGMISFSFALYNKTMLTMATREGARAGALYVETRTNSITINNATEAVKDACKNNLISFGSEITPTVTCNGNPIGDKKLIVSASIIYIPLRFDWFYVFPDSLKISAKTSMRVEE